jgi:hypothetical protein
MHGILAFAMLNVLRDMLHMMMNLSVEKFVRIINLLLLLTRFVMTVTGLLKDQPNALTNGLSHQTSSLMSVKMVSIYLMTENHVLFVTSQNSLTRMENVLLVHLGFQVVEDVHSPMLQILKLSCAGNA